METDRSPKTDARWTAFQAFFFCRHILLVAFCNVINVIRKHLESEQIFAALLLPPLVLVANRCKTSRESTHKDCFFLMLALAPMAGPWRCVDRSAAQCSS